MAIFIAAAAVSSEGAARLIMAFSTAVETLYV
jgi:hypothetical protein